MDLIAHGARSVWRERLLITSWQTRSRSWWGTSLHPQALPKPPTSSIQAPPLRGPRTAHNSVTSWKTSHLLHGPAPHIQTKARAFYVKPWKEWPPPGLDPWDSCLLTCFRDLPPNQAGSPAWTRSEASCIQRPLHPTPPLLCSSTSPPTGCLVGPDCQ